MAYDIGPKIGIDGEAEFRKAVQAINTNIKTLSTEMLAVTSAYAANDKSAAALTSRNEVLVKQIDAQKEKLTKLQEGLAASAAKYGESDEKTQRWQQTVNKAAAELNQMERQLQENTRELAGNTGEISENTDELKKQSSALDGIGGKLKTVGSGFAAAAKAAAAGIAAASAAVGVLVKSSLDGYAECEQLIGGVETLFQSSSGKVLAYANNAYKTAGLSANEYMETVTGFSASLLQSLNGDTAKAAEAADQAITDMSDNANKMGSSMESIQNAYQGFAKQNYTMLDNLKLGYGGTKEEMQRLLSDAEALAGKKFDLSSYADIIEAIHVVQTEMGITGTTAKEASTTIQGSIGAMKSAWENLVTGLAGDSENLDQLIGNFVDSVATAGENILPRIETILSGIGEMIARLAPVIAEEAPKLVMNILPSMLDAGVQLLTGIVEGLVSAVPMLADSSVELVDFLVENLMDLLPELAGAALEIITTLATGMADSLPELVPTVVDVMLQIVETLTDPSNLNNLVSAALEIITALAEGLLKALPTLAGRVPEIITNIVTTLTTNLPKIVTMAGTIITTLADNLIKALPTLAGKVPEVITNIVTTLTTNLPKIVTMAGTIITTLADNLIKALPTLAGKVPEVITNIVTTLTTNLPKIVTMAGTIITTLATGLIQAIPNLVRSIPQIVTSIVSGFTSAAVQFRDIGENIVDGVWQGIKNMGSWLREQVSGFFSGIVDGVKNVLGIHSPSKVFAGIGGYMAEGLGEGFGDEMGSVQRNIRRSMAELAGNASGTVRMESVQAPAAASGGAGGYSRDDIAAAFQQALAGMSIYLDNRRVGQLITTWQNNDDKAWAR